MTDWRDRLRRAMRDRKFNMKELSKAAGLGETAVRDALERHGSPRIDTVRAIANVLGMTVAELIEGDATGLIKIPVIGCVSAGDGWAPFGDEADNGLGQLDFIVEQPAVALEVRGDSMAPAYRDGDTIIGTQRAGTRADNLIGQDCIVMTSDGSRYIKFLMRGTAKGRFNLRSYNPAHADIENVKLEWAAPIVWVKRGQK